MISNSKTPPIILDNNTTINDKDKLIFFSSVTGTIMKPEQREEDMYEVDEDDWIEEKTNEIDKFTDICKTDKMFFKLWNEFIRKRDQSSIHMEGPMTEFIKQHSEIIIVTHLENSLLNHLLCLYDHDQLSNESFSNLINYFNKEKEKYKDIQINE